MSEARPNSRGGPWGALAARLGSVGHHRSLLIGALVLLVCAASFGRLLDDVSESDGITIFDRHVTGVVADNRSHTVSDVFLLLTMIGTPQILTLITAAAAGLLAWRTRQPWPMLTALLADGGARALVYLVKHVVERERPSSALAVDSAYGYSFPSGHATGSLVTFGIIAFLAAATVKSRGRRVALWAAAAVTTIGVGCSRIYLGVHYLSDVLAAWSIGISWLTVLIVVSTMISSRCIPGELMATRAWRDRDATSDDTDTCGTTVDVQSRRPPGMRRRRSSGGPTHTSLGVVGG